MRLYQKTRKFSTIALHDYAKRGRDSRFFALNEMFRSRGLSALAPSPHVKSTGLYMPNHALTELEMRYAISSSVKAPLALRSKRANVFACVIFASRARQI
ncbi:hypothetical protein HMPREF1586_01132 [Gardnerella vaginalis JCP8522]|nr:hypothetical protein HMPREF1586_01132 [Gardnerella vaginalis JCP8522]